MGGPVPIPPRKFTGPPVGNPRARPSRKGKPGSRIESESTKMVVRTLAQLPSEAQPHIAAAGRVLAHATARMNSMSPREIAEAAYTPSGPSLEELERIAEARLAGRPVSTPAVAA